MAGRGHAKLVFPGGNTSKGFYSFYDHIIPIDAKRIFVIKGGPGVGKSSLMKAVAEEFLAKGYDVEKHYCSSDNNSLDGLVIPNANIALIDGTAPHIVDPKTPGAVDEIINLGEFWNEEGMIKHKQEILNCNKGVRDFFYSAYHYLAAAKEMQDDIDDAIDFAVDRAKFNQMLLELKSEVVDGTDVMERAGKIRHLFDTAITPDGVVDYIDTIITKRHECYYLKGEHAKGSSEILSKFAEALCIRGYDVELYHQPLNPDRLNTLVVDELDLAVTVNPKLEASAYMIVNLDNNIVKNKLKDKQEMLTIDREMLKTMLDEAVVRIGKAKKLHDVMETYYISNMDFKAIDTVKAVTIERIRNMVE
ncbi:MAG: hypothetical protein ACOZCL_16160 [Bacillota bacterium]